MDAFLALLGKEKAPSQAVTLVKSNGLKSGMVLGANLVSPDNLMLLSKGHELDDALIQRIQGLEEAFDEDLEIYVIVTKE